MLGKPIHLSGEPIVPQIGIVFPRGKLKQPMNLVDYEDVVLKMKSYRDDYQKYWRSTAERSQNGKARTNYPCVVIPVTFADKVLDKVPSKFQPLTENDRKNMAACKYLSDDLERDF